MEIYQRYIAKDGMSFDDPIKCQEHEKTIGILKGSVGELVIEIQKNCTDNQFVSGIILVKQAKGKSDIYVRYTGCIDHKLEDYVSVDNLTEEQRYESATIGDLLERLKKIDKGLPCQYMLAYSDYLDMHSPGMMGSYNAKAWSNEEKEL